MSRLKQPIEATHFIVACKGRGSMHPISVYPPASVAPGHTVTFVDGQTALKRKAAVMLHLSKEPDASAYIGMVPYDPNQHTLDAYIARTL